MDISILRVAQGDCIWIRWKDESIHNLIVDSGPARTKAMFRHLVQDEIISKGECIDLLVLTHIDDDHIRGFLYYLADHGTEMIKNKFQEIWFNTGIRCLSSLQSPNSATALSCKLNSLGIHYCDHIVKGRSFTLGDVKLKVICPDDESVEIVDQRIVQQHMALHAAPQNGSLSDILANDHFSEDTSDTNKASIAMILTYKGKYNIALLGDAHDENIQEGLSEFFSGQAMDMVKLSHHGSSYNLSNELIDMLASREFILSTSHEMDIVTLARLYQKTLDTHKSMMIYSNYSQPLAIQRLAEVRNNVLTIKELGNAPILLWEDGESVCQIKTIS